MEALSKIVGVFKIRFGVFKINYGDFSYLVYHFVIKNVTIYFSRITEHHFHNYIYLVMNISIEI